MGTNLDIKSPFVTAAFLGVTEQAPPAMLPGAQVLGLIPKAKTRRVWSKAYGRPVSTEESAEILMNVKHMAEVLIKAKRGGDVK